MNNSPHLPKIVKGKPSTITLQSLYEYIELLEKRREERVFNLQPELEAMLENKFTSFEVKVQKQIENKIKPLQNKMETMEIRLLVIEKQSQDKNQTSQQGDVDTLESLKMKGMIKSLEEKFNNNLTLNNVEGKLDIKHIFFCKLRSNILKREKNSSTCKNTVWPTQVEQIWSAKV